MPTETPTWEDSKEIAPTWADSSPVPTWESSNEVGTTPLTPSQLDTMAARPPSKGPAVSPWGDVAGQPQTDLTEALARGAQTGAGYVGKALGAAADIAKGAYGVGGFELAGDNASMVDQARAAMANAKARFTGEEIQPTPFEEGIHALSGPARVAANVPYQIVGMTPKLAALALAPQSLPAQMMASGGLFGMDDSGNFDVKEAGLMALLPGVSAGARLVIAKNVAKGIEAGFGSLENPTVQKFLTIGGDQAVMNGYMLAMQTPQLAELSKTDPGKFWEEVGNTVGQNFAFAALHAKQDGGEPIRSEVRDKATAAANDAAMLGTMPEGWQPAESFISPEETRKAPESPQVATQGEPALPPDRNAISETVTPPAAAQVATHPDGTPDEITTSLNKIRAEAEATPASKADVSDLADQLKDLQAVLQGNQVAGGRAAEQDILEKANAAGQLDEAGKAKLDEVVAQDQGKAKRAEWESQLRAQIEAEKAKTLPAAPAEPKNAPAEGAELKSAPEPGQSVEPQTTETGTAPLPSRKGFRIQPRSDGVADVLDAIQEEGGIRSPDKSDTGGEYDGHKESMVGVASLLRRRGSGMRPDEAIKAIQSEFPRIQTPGDLWKAIRDAVAQRERLKTTGGGHEAQTQRFWDAVAKPENEAGFEKISVDQLAVGQKFRLKGKGISHAELTVQHVSPDDGTVQVKDGPVFGHQDLPEGTEIYIRKGSLAEAPQAKFSPGEENPIPEKQNLKALRAEQAARGEQVARDNLQDPEQIRQAAKEVKEGLKMAGSAESKAKLKGYLEGLEKHLDSLKLDTNGQLHAFGLIPETWNTLVDLVKLAVKGGIHVRDAIDWAISKFREDHPDAKEFDEDGARRFFYQHAAQDSFSKSGKELDAQLEELKSEQKNTNESRKPKPELHKAGTERNLDDIQYSESDTRKVSERPERERSPAEIETEIQSAKDALEAGLRNKEATPAARRAQATADTLRLRNLQDELAHHPEHIANQILQQHEAITEANQILKPHGMAVNPGDLPDLSRLHEILQPEQFDRVRELLNTVDRTHGELFKSPKKMVSRVTEDMIADGRLPDMKPITTNAGRSLEQVTDWMRANKSDSPKRSLLERMNLAGQAAEQLANLKTAFDKARATAEAMIQTGVESWKSPPTDTDFRHIQKSWHVYDRRTAAADFEYAKALVQQVPDSLRRKAISVWLEAKGDRATLQFQHDAVPEKYLPIWKAALDLTPGEKALAMKIKADFDQKLEDGIKTGLIQQGRVDYGVPHHWEVAPKPEEGTAAKLDERQPSAGNPYAKLDTRNPFFSLERQVPTYFDGIMGGGVPKNLDIAHLVTHYDEAFHKALSSRGMVGALQDATAKDGKPVVVISGSANKGEARGDDGAAILVDSNRRNPDAVTEDGRFYRSIDHPSLHDWKVRTRDDAGNPVIVKGDMLVHPDHYEFLRNELNDPKWTRKLRQDESRSLVESFGHAALRAGSFLKSSKFIGPFHIVTEAIHASFHGVFPSVRGFKIDFNDPQQQALARNMELGFGRARELFEEGLSSQGGIYKYVPGLGQAIVKLNNFTFQEYIPRLKMKVGLAVLDRNMARYSKDTMSGPALRPEQIAEVTGRQMDAAFGGQNWRLLGTNKNTLGAMRLALVAPDFLISRSKVIGQAFKPYNAEQRIFLAAQAGAVYALSRIINAAFSDDHDPHWEAKNWDRVIIGKRSYGARFIVSDAASLARDLAGLKGGMQNGIPFITGRMGVAPKMAAEIMTGRDLFTGQKKEGLISTDNAALRIMSIAAQDGLEWLVPMGVEGFLPGAKAKGNTGLGSAAVALVGVGSRKESPGNELWDAARQFNINSKDPAAVRFQRQRDADSGTPSDYRALNNLIDSGDTSKIKAEIARLEADGHRPESIAAHYQHNLYFTGQKEREAAFYNSLSTAQRALYQKATQERAERAAALGKAMQ